MTTHHFPCKLPKPQSLYCAVISQNPQASAKCNKFHSITIKSLYSYSEHPNIGPTTKHSRLESMPVLFDHPPADWAGYSHSGHPAPSLYSPFFPIFLHASHFSMNAFTHQHCVSYFEILALCHFFLHTFSSFHRF